MGLRGLIGQHGPNTQELGRRSGVNGSTISKLVNNQRQGRYAATVDALARALEVRPEWLRLGTGPIEDATLSAETREMPIPEPLRLALVTARAQGRTYDEETIATVRRRWQGQRLDEATYRKLLDTEETAVELGRLTVERALAR